MLPVGMATTSICFFLVDMCRSILNMRALGGFFFFSILGQTVLLNWQGLIFF